MYLGDNHVGDLALSTVGILYLEITPQKISVSAVYHTIITVFFYFIL